MDADRGWTQGARLAIVVLGLFLAAGLASAAEIREEPAPEIAAADAAALPGSDGAAPVETVHYVLTDAPVPDAPLDSAQQDQQASQDGTETEAHPRTFVFTFSLNQPGNVLIRLTDSHGNTVITLVDEWKPSGDFETTWNGCDMRGDAVDCGAYVIHARLPGKCPLRQVVLVK